MMTDYGVVLITGGSGTFGRAFLRYVLDQGARQVRVFSRDELKQSEMEASIKDERVKYVCGDVRDSFRIMQACQGVDIVVHAAAMKRMETCEREPQEAVKTNVMGSLNVINACQSNGVKHAISLSSDKAVYPVNTYGKTKALMESVWIQSNEGLGSSHSTKFSVVRYGNVMGSRGSVADIFRKQAKSGSIKVTNADMTRFFMHVGVATGLVNYAIWAQQGGEIFVPALKSASIGDLARAIDAEKQIDIIGPRPGEKVHEDIITTKETARAWLSRDDVAVIDPEYCIWPYVQGERKPVDFPVNSGTATRFTEEELKKLLEVSPT